MPLDRNAEEARAALVLADRHQGAAERRAQHEPHQANGGGEDRQQKEIEPGLALGDIEREPAEADRLAMKIAQAVEAAGEIVPAIGEVIPELAEGDRAHGEIDAAAAHDQHAEQRAGQTAEQRAGQHGKRRRMHEVAQRQSGAVGAEPEIGGVAKTQYAGEAEQAC